MRTAYFETIGGIAGDMTMASLVGAGVPLDDLIARLSALSVRNFEILGRHVTRSGIDAVQLEVVVTERNDKHRHLHHVFNILDESALSQTTRDRAKAIFRVLAEAEARVHNTTIEKVHFHEVGAIDAIVDVVGTTLCLEMLGVDHVLTSPIKMGGQGFVKAAHGNLPVASPAAMEILRGYPVLMTNAPHELTTPTGAAIVKALSAGMMTDQPFVVDSIGYGAGMAEFNEFPNLLRVLVGELGEAGRGEFIELVETTIDDMNPQFYPFILEKLLAIGARDAFLTPVIMKKGRPGILLSVLTESSTLPLVTETIYANTSTIGLRVQRVSRKTLPRRELVIDTALGPVKAKAVLRNGKEQVTPEFEECRRLSLEKNLPIPEVYRIIEKDLPRGI